MHDPPNPTSGYSWESPRGVSCVCAVATPATTGPTWASPSQASAVLERALSPELLQPLRPPVFRLRLGSHSASLANAVFTLPVLPSPFSLSVSDAVCLSLSVLPFPAASDFLPAL